MSAQFAGPGQPLSELVQLGQNHDTRPFREPDNPWQPGEIPHGVDTDLDEYPVELLKMRRCRSFRADLRHKLTLIIRAQGGYGHKGVERTAKAMRVARQTIWKWLRWDSAPKTRLHFERLDNLYAESFETLVAEKLKRKRRRKNEVG